VAFAKPLKAQLIALVVCCLVAGAQTKSTKPKAAPLDISQEISGIVAIRENNGSVRPAPLVTVGIYEPVSVEPTAESPWTAWVRLKNETREKLRNHTPLSYECQEVLSANVAESSVHSVYSRAKETGKWDTVNNKIKLVPFDRVTTDEKGHFTDNVAIADISIYGKFLLVAMLTTPTQTLLWEQEIEVKQGEKIPPIILSDPTVCRN